MWSLEFRAICILPLPPNSPKKSEHVFCCTSLHPVIPLAGVRVKASFPSISSCSLLPLQQTASSGRARQSRVRLRMLVRVSHCCNWWQFKV